MARSIRDLRDFINVSRLSFRSSDSEEDGAESYDDERHGGKQFLSFGSINQSTHGDYDKSVKEFNIPRPSSSLTRDKNDEIVIGRPNSSVGIRRPPSFMATSRPSHIEFRDVSTHQFTPASERRLDKSSGYNAEVDSCVGALQSLAVHRRKQEFSDENVISNTEISQGQNRSQIDEIFRFVDAAVVNSWLERSNKQLDGITKWLEMDDNFLKIAHFLLSNFDQNQREQLLEMEISIILDEFQLAFRVGLDSKKVKLKNLAKLLSIVLREYPSKFHGKDGAKFMLDVLFVFSSGRNEKFKKLLANVKYSTKNKQIAQWMLAIRAFSLIGLCNGILEFAQNILTSGLFSDSAGHIASPATSLNKIHSWVFKAVDHGFLDVLQYFLAKDETLATIVDEQGRNLIFRAVISDKEEILDFLIKRVTPKIDVNKCSDSGNTPLHLAVPKGNIKIIQLLIENGADVNYSNCESEGATPLHLAVINGDLNIVKLLVENGADVKLCMGNPSTLTPADLAKDFGKEEIYHFLTNS